jgi:hypothetical protein
MPRIESDGRGFDTHGAYHEKARFNQKDYTHYVVVARGGVPFIESGWSYPEDAKDQLTNGNLPDGIKAKVVTGIGLKRAGVDPDDNKNWLRGQWWTEGGFEGASRIPTFVGEISNAGFVGGGSTLYAIKIEGVDPTFLDRPFGRQAEEWQKIREWQKTAKHDWFTAKPRKGQNAKTELKRWIKAVNPKEFFAKLNPGDDSHQIFYTVGSDLKVGPGRPGQKFSHGDVEIETTLHPLEGVSPRTRLGTRVRFIGHSFGYSNPPEKGEEGIVTYMPGYKPKTYLPGPGGGLLYVKWDNLGVMGVSPNDVESVMPEGRLNVGSYGSRGKRSGLGDSGKAISEHKIKDHGVEHEQYFQGCGISHSKWDEVASGVGSTPMEAYEDALDSLAQNGWDVESLPQDGEGLSKKSEIPPNEPIGYNPSGYSEDLHHYVCVYVKGL